MNTLPRRRSSVLTAACLLALAGAPLASQAAQEMDIDRIVQTAMADVGDALDHVDFDAASVAFASDEMGSERVVKGAPYCADAVHESVQTLTDGNRIVRKQQTRLCRDGEGRTRQEVDRGGRKLVWLRDPVAKQGWLLDPERKTARRLGHFGHVGHAGQPMWFNDAAVGAEHAEQWRAYADKAREQAKVMAEQARQQVQEARATQERLRAEAKSSRTPQPAQVAQPAQAPQPVLIARPATAAEAMVTPGQPMDIQVMRLNSSGPLLAPAQPGAVMNLMPPPPPPVVRWQAQRVAPRGQGVQSSLGSKDIEGVRANGERTTWTIEAGKIGNEKPIQIVHEVWTSPDLLLTVQSRDADPRSAERIYRLTNLKRGEPDAALMKVPADYAVSSAMPSTPAMPVPRKPGGAGSAPRG
ncbi:MAG TPA: hypothetical protein VFY73_23385 [Ideonella sp.]|uniref:hypothetical protein n=1 Tax=Ideonella sp. TaxID=1929293 RepID=UPI002E378311|nr:hypothetical protein [Ideonella sp.]HEX5686966.1 hypothetical protein [Ideonella sp.]